VSPLLSKRYYLLHGGLTPLLFLSAGLSGVGEDASVCVGSVTWRWQWRSLMNGV
jgi:hypothetical protein